MSEIMHIAPCGMNCSLCVAFQGIGKSRKCGGCNVNIAEGTTRCTIVHCKKRAETESGFCYDCPKMPCRRLQTIDERYRNNYGMSMLDNLTVVKEKGIEQFRISEGGKWTCTECGSLLCVHRDRCPKCKAINKYFTVKK